MLFTNWIVNNLASIIVSILILFGVFWAIKVTMDNRKAGKHSCGGNCGSCGMSGICHLENRLAAGTPEAARTPQAPTAPTPDIPHHVEGVLRKLEEAGYEAYVVGGCVRDTIMGKIPADWDVCTSARPEETKKCFSDFQTIDIGMKHGTVGVIFPMKDSGCTECCDTYYDVVEITTYRIDGSYEDSRHPDQVTFTSKPEEDLGRRDFTMNAIACDRKGNYVDPYGGQADIETQTIRTVGDPEQRFTEDALRIMRGLRFAAQMGFHIEEKTAAAMEKLADTVRKVSAERVQTELSKLIAGPYADQVLKEHQGTLSKAIPGIRCTSVGQLPDTKTIRLAKLFPYDTELHMKELRMDRKTTVETTALTRLFKEATPETDVEIKQLIRREGPEIAALYMEATGNSDRLKKIMESNLCCTVEQLDISGRDLISMGVKDGPTIGAVLERLLNKVIEEKMENEREALMEAVNKVWVLNFSPTGSTRKISEAVASAVGKELKMPVESVDVTRPESREKIYRFEEDDIVILATPTYAGRVPNKIMPFFRDNIKGKGTKAATLVTYGNRSYQDSLMELTLMAEDNGFNVIGGGAFVCRHAFAENLASGRPDEEDLQKAIAFGKAIGDKILKQDWTRPEIPGNNPVGPYYTPKKPDGQPAVFLKAKPETDKDKCRGCGLCGDRCPMGSISREDPSQVTGICIKCQSCIKVCKAGAKVFTDEDFLLHRQMLEENFAKERKEVEFYL